MFHPLENFMKACAAAGDTFKIILLNCDKRQQEYNEHLKAMHWCMAIPFDADPWIIENLETLAHASVIPKLCVFSVEKGFQKCVLQDVKHTLLKMDD